MHLSLISFVRQITPATLATAFVAFIFTTTAPFALITAAATKGGLGEAQIASWVFGGFFINGFITIAFSLIYRQPLVFLWTMPGTVLVGQALTHLSMPQIISAFIASAILILVLGLSGMVRRVMEAIPTPVVMGMVAGVFLQFSIDWIKAFETEFWIVAPMTAVYFALLLAPAIARLIPPLIAALVVGTAIAVGTGSGNDVGPISLSIAPPTLTMPVFSLPAIIELTLPVAITVLVVQNGQGIGVITHAGHKPPINNITTACGVSSLITSTMGAVTSCLAGPVSAILVTGETRERQYVSAVLLGAMCIVFGLMGPLMTRLALSAPHALIATLAGLAMLKILESAFAAAFSGRHTYSALITLVVTLSGISIANIGAPFWGIVAGYLAARVLEQRER
ncbi:MAG: benzoate/H(+) symporter BenE family transporter [Hyphomicrobiaceae bacterium]